MAEKDAQYYMAQAQNARENGNERLAQIMENYARNLGAGIYRDDTPAWRPNRNASAPTRESLQNMYNQKMAMEQAQPTYGGGNAAPNGRQYVVDDPEMAAPMGSQAPVSYAQMGGNVADFKRGEYSAPPVQADIAPRTGGDYDPNWNANTFRSNSTVQSQWDADQARRANYPEKTGYQFDDSYGRRLRDNYQSSRQQQPPAARRNGSEGDMPTWPELFPNW